MLGYVKQRTHTDCGVASVAMLAGVTYEVALAAFRFKHNSKTRKSNTKQCKAALERLGCVVRQTRLRPWKELASRNHSCLLKTKERHRPNRRGWHWCVYCAEQAALLDPGHGVATLKIYSYLEVERAETTQVDQAGASVS